MTNPFGAPLLAVILCAATLTACSNKTAEPSSDPARSSASATATPTVQTSPAGGPSRAELTVNGHIHNISGPVNCTAQEANPSGTPPLGNLAISASDETASFGMSWLSNAPSPLMALTFSYKLDGGEYTMPYHPERPNVEATAQGNNYTVKGTPPVLALGKSTLTKNLPVEIHATCP
ncbi:MAG: lipoprotein LpqH [Mycobacterium sp.]|jgi:Mycobacterium 19 kDa lipoprotein antigen|uniref:lipoprotein LpqH n=1 Tax=Mycobacterium sp. TaxID=1785 RepID=UPI003C74043C